MINMSLAKHCSLNLLATLRARSMVLLSSRSLHAFGRIFPENPTVSSNHAHAFERPAFRLFVIQSCQPRLIARSYKNLAHNIEKRPPKQSYWSLTFGIMALVGMIVFQFDWMYIGTEFPQLRFDLFPIAHESYMRQEHLKQELDYEHGIESLPLTLWTESEKRDFNLKPQYLPPDAPVPSYRLPPHLQPNEPQRQDYWIPPDAPLPTKKPASVSK